MQTCETWTLHAHLELFQRCMWQLGQARGPAAGRLAVAVTVAIAAAAVAAAASGACADAAGAATPLGHTRCCAALGAAAPASASRGGGCTSITGLLLGWLGGTEESASLGRSPCCDVGGSGTDAGCDLSFCAGGGADGPDLADSAHGRVVVQVCPSCMQYALRLHGSWASPTVGTPWAAAA